VIVFLNADEGENSILWFIIFIGVFLSAFAGADTGGLEALQTQYANLKTHLAEAEEVPGPQGLDQVKHYHAKIKDVEAQLKKAGLKVGSFEDVNAPWKQDDQTMAISTALGLHPEIALSPATALREELQKIEQKLERVVLMMEGEEASGLLMKEMNVLLEKRQDLSKKIKEFEDHPERLVRHVENRDAVDDLKNKDASVIQGLQDHLQSIYSEIYLLRQRTLSSKHGHDIHQQGISITKLEHEERTIKKRLKNMGVTPLPPRVLEDGELPNLEGKTFSNQLQEHLKTLDTKIVGVHSSINEAKSGHDIARLGLEMTRLQQERVLVDKMMMEERQKTALVEGSPAPAEKAAAMPPGPQALGVQKAMPVETPRYYGKYQLWDITNQSTFTGQQQQRMVEGVARNMSQGSYSPTFHAVSKI